LSKHQLLLSMAPARRTTEAVSTNYGDLADKQLISYVAQGDAVALETLYDRYAAAVLGLAFKILGDRTSAEEVVQETFWRVWRSGGTFSNRHGSFTSWLFGITRNQCIDLWRRRNSRPQTLLDDTAEQSPRDSVTDVAESAWTAIKRRQVRAAMEVLPPAQRRVIELAYFGGLTRQEIADNIGVPLGTVHTRARLGLQKLRDALRQEGFED